MKLIKLDEGDEEGQRGRTLYEGAKSRVKQIVLAPGGSIPAHRHDGDEMVMIPRQGVGRVTVDGEAFELQVGSVFCSDGGHEFLLENVGTGEFEVVATLVSLRSYSS